MSRVRKSITNYFRSMKGFRIVPTPHSSHQRISIRRNNAPETIVEIHNELQTKLNRIQNWISEEIREYRGNNARTKRQPTFVSLLRDFVQRTVELHNFVEGISSIERAIRFEKKVNCIISDLTEVANEERERNGHDGLIRLIT